ncbi:Serine/Threonine kinase domain protein [Quillaja saponaria]|uniref:Serine/Threonine kinase domain protein n=1 Tax=Quillaja saponaria TaxID=32244 RepID=A0AAD7P5U3_QUISA|nr:Serine/Threonine kinase domain protein [Quillaja saponaria]
MIDIHYEFESWRGSRLSIRSRERSCSHGIIEEDDQCRRDSSEQESFLYSDKLNTEYDLDEGRHQGRREWWRGCRGSVGEDRRECSASYRSRYSRREDRHQGRETLSRDKSMERYVDKDIRGVKERRSMDREMERAHRREKKRESSTDREMDHVSRRDKKRGRSWERDMKRDIELDRIREGKVDRDRRGGNRRDRSWDAVSDRDWRRERGRSRDKTRGVERDREETDWKRERQGDRNTYNSRDVKNDKWKYLDHDVRSWHL